MGRLPWAIVNGLVSVALMTAAVVLMMPTDFRHSKDKEVAVRIDWSNLLCKTPKPNLNISDEDVYHFWLLPNKVRLSQRMVEAGKCCVAVARNNERSTVKIDWSVCFCANIWWVPVMALVSFVLGLASTIHFASGIAMRNRRPFTATEMRAQNRSEVCRNALVAAAAVVYMINSGSEFSYTDYGDIYPSEYLNVMPATWQASLYLFLGGNILQSLAFFVLNICCNGSASKNGGMTNPTAKKSAAPVSLKRAQAPTDSVKPFKATIVSENAADASIDRQPDHGRNVAKESGAPVLIGKGQLPATSSPSPSALVTVCECVTVAKMSDPSYSESVTLFSSDPENCPQWKTLMLEDDGEKKPKSGVVIAVGGNEEAKEKKGCKSADGTNQLRKGEKKVEEKPTKRKSV